MALNKQLGIQVSSPNPVIQKNTSPIPDFEGEPLKRKMSSKRGVFVLGVNGAANCGKTFYSKIFKEHAEKIGLVVCVLKEVPDFHLNPSEIS